MCRGKECSTFYKDATSEVKHDLLTAGQELFEGLKWTSKEFLRISQTFRVKQICTDAAGTNTKFYDPKNVWDVFWTLPENSWKDFFLRENTIRSKEKPKQKDAF